MCSFLVYESEGLPVQRGGLRREKTHGSAPAGMEEPSAYKRAHMDCSSQAASGRRATSKIFNRYPRLWVTHLGGMFTISLTTQQTNGGAARPVAIKRRPRLTVFNVKIR